MRKKARREGERLVEFLIGGIVVLTSNIFLFIGAIFFLPVVNPASSRSEGGEKNVREKHASPDPDLFDDAEFCETLANLSNQKSCCSSFSVL